MATATVLSESGYVPPILPCDGSSAKPIDPQIRLSATDWVAVGRDFPLLNGVAATQEERA